LRGSNATEAIFSSPPKSTDIFRAFSLYVVYYGIVITIMKQTTPLIFFIIFLFSFLQMNCKKDPITPSADDKPDTTSHNFTWQTFTWGGGGSSSIQDVAIINDTNIWAVGEIQLPDSTYNAAHWNGKRWELISIPTEMFGGFIGCYRLNTIIAFNNNDIWTFSIAGSYSHWDGIKWTTKFVSERSGGGTKYWGTSSSNLYLVGTNGSITHYNGNSWEKIESGTTLDLHDIYGATDSKTGEQQILVVGSSNIPFDRVILQIQGNSVTKLSTTPIEYELRSVWFLPNQHYYVVGDGIFEKNSIGESNWRINSLDITPFATTAVSGNGLNDVFVVGAFGECLHWNGVTWKSYRDKTKIEDSALGALGVKGNLVVAGGQTGQNAIILIGKR
jgi:hypothetical protein